MKAKPRIVIYGVGQYGGYLARFAVQKGWPIVAAFNRAGPKVGQDLGRVIGLDRDLGIIIQGCDNADYAAPRGKADIGLVAQTNPLSVNLPAYRRLLNAGLNIQPGEIEHTCWEVVDGMPHTRIRVERDDSAHATASNLFNRVPDIIAAPAGIICVHQMGPLKTTAIN